jgi:hypothetical protein
VNTVDDYLQALQTHGEASMLRQMKPVLLQLVHDDKPVLDVTPWQGHDLEQARNIGALPVYRLMKRNVEASDPRITIGRSRSADVTLPLARVSKIHAYLCPLKDGQLEITDAESKNGTLIGDRQIAANAPTPVKSGAILSLGPYPFRYFSAEGFVAWLKRASISEGATETGQNAQGRLEIVGPLGRGGMADVALAKRVGPGGFQKQIALKRLLPEMAHDKHFVDMFLQEAKIAARINHPNVVQIFDLGWDGQRYFIAMEYVHGWNLATIQRAARRLQKQMPVPVALKIGIDVCAGLRAAHTCVDDKGTSLEIVHRDVSPQNVLVSTDGVVKITDFGISRAADSIRRTRPGELKGKLAYMAPEQLDEQFGVVDKRTDIFAASLTIYECLFGTALFRRGNDVDTMHAVLNEVIPDLRHLRSDVTPGFAQALARGLARRPNDRFKNVADLEAALVEAGRELAPSATAISEWLVELGGERGLPHVGVKAPESAKTEVVRDKR